MLRSKIIFCGLLLASLMLCEVSSACGLFGIFARVGARRQARIENRISRREARAEARIGYNQAGCSNYRINGRFR